MTTAIATRVRGSILECIGNTPIVRLGRLSGAAGAELLGKAEYLNPGGSLKDRVALALVRAAEEDGSLRPGGSLIEATAGNTGIGLALVAAACGYRFVAVMTEADRGPKSEVMEGLGASVVFTPAGAAWESALGPIGVAARLAREHGHVFVNQFANPANPLAHQRATAAEIEAAVGDEVDVVVAGVGTGGTAVGLARALRPRRPRLRLIGVVGAGSYLGSGSGHGHDRIAGITPDAPPPVFEPGCVDAIEPVTAAAAADAARRLAEIEGIPAGHSAGACLVAAEREARRRPGCTILLIIGDSARNYGRGGAGSAVAVSWRRRRR